MTERAKTVNTVLKEALTMIRRCEPGKGRDALQARFDLTIDRIKQIPDRVLMQLDAGTIGNNIELDDVHRTEWLWALDPLKVAEE